MGGSLRHRAVEPEQMDDPMLPVADYDAVLRDLGRVNAVTLATRPTLAFIRRQAAAIRALDRPLRILDVGFGDARMLARRRIGCTLIGIDLNPRSAPLAASLTPDDWPIAYRTGDYRDLAGQGWDMVISSLVCHHMDAQELSAFLAFMEAESRLGWFVNDLHRLAFAYHGYPLLARLLRVHRIVREDGQLSIARSFRPPEWRAILSGAGLDAVAEVRRVFPFRLCVERVR